MARVIVSENTKIENIRPGDILGKNILRANGQMVLTKGTELTAGLIDQLKRIGLTHIHIEKEEETEDINVEPPDEKMRIVLELQERQFSLISPNHPVMSKLKEIFRDYLLERLSDGIK